MNIVSIATETEKVSRNGGNNRKGESESDEKVSNRKDEETRDRKSSKVLNGQIGNFIIDRIVMAPLTL